MYPLGTYFILMELEQETKLTNFWSVYGLVDNVTSVSLHS